MSQRTAWFRFSVSQFLLRVAHCAIALGFLSTLWRAVDGRFIVSTLAVSPDGRTVAAANMDGSVQLWDVGTYKGVGNVRTEASSRILEFAVPNECDRVVVNECTRIVAYNLRDGTKKVLLDNVGVVYAVSADGAWCVVDNGFGRLQVLQIGDAPQVVLDQANTASSKSICTDGHLLILLGHDGVLQAWDIPSRTLLQTLSASSPMYLSPKFSLDGTHILAFPKIFKSEIEKEDDVSTAVQDLTRLYPSGTSFTRRNAHYIQESAISLDCKEIAVVTHVGVFIANVDGKTPALKLCGNVHEVAPTSTGWVTSTPWQVNLWDGETHQHLTNLVRPQTILQLSIVSIALAVTMWISMRIARKARPPVDLR